MTGNPGRPAAPPANPLDGLLAAAALAAAFGGGAAASRWLESLLRDGERAASAPRPDSPDPDKKDRGPNQAPPLILERLYGRDIGRAEEGGAAGG